MSQWECTICHEQWSQESGSDPQRHKPGCPNATAPDHEQAGRLERDWGDALRLAQLWGQYWTDDSAAVRLSTERAGFLARSLLAALERLEKAEAQLAEQERALRWIASNALAWHAGEDGKERALHVIAGWAAGSLALPPGDADSTSRAER